MTPPELTVPVEQASIPWRLASQNPDGYSATIQASVPSCDRGSTSTVVGPASTEVQQLAYGPLGQHCAGLTAATVTSSLPAHLTHDPLGAYLEPANPPPAPATPGRLIGPLPLTGTGSTVTIHVGDVVVAPPIPGPPHPDTIVSSNPAVLGVLAPANPIGEFRAWKAGHATLSVRPGACQASTSPLCGHPWAVHVTVEARPHE